MKAIELTGKPLDFAVAMCAKLPIRHDPMGFKTGSEAGYWVWDDSRHGMQEKIGSGYSPSTNRNQCGEIVERKGISVIRCDDDYGVDAEGYCNNQRIPVWGAVLGQHSVETSTEHQSHDAMYQIYAAEMVYGPTPLIAAMRCHVLSELGAEIDIPPDLL